MEETKSNMNIKRDYKNISPLMAEESKLPIRPILKKPYYQLVQSLNEQRTNQKFLFQAFCGIGKSRPMYNIIFDCYNTYDLIVFVFPFINLLTQFKEDYISRIETDKQFKILSICSAKEKGRVTKITTNTVDIKATLSSNKKKIILVTYQSLKTLYDCLENRIDLCIFDEAHHSVGKESKSLIYTNPKYDNAVFFTATPANKHGITMYEEGIDSHCGKRIVNATFIDGLNSDTLVPFEIRGNIMNNQKHDVQSKINRIYEIIIRNIFLTGNNRVLTFHTYANSNDTSTSSYGDSDFDSNVESDIESDFSEESAKVEVVEEKKETKLETEEDTEYNFKTNVQDFVNEALFSSIFKDIKKEFFELRNKYKKITFRAMTTKTSLSIRNKWLRELDNAKDDEIYIISSCKTIGEGVDTKNVNHIVFVDSKSSYIDIIQNIGRGVRKTDQKHRPTTITIPSFINYERYRGADTEEKRDETIRSGIAKYGDFSGIMNVLTAIQQEDEEYYKMCLQYPNKLFKREVERNLETQDKYMSDTGKQLESITGVEREEKETEEDYLNSVAVQKDEQIELHTNDIDDNIKYYGDETKPIGSRIYKDDESLENNYYEIEDRARTNQKSKRCTRHKITDIKIKYDDEFKVLWHIENDDELIRNQVSSCILNFSLSGKYCIGKWKAKLREVYKFVIENGRLPSQGQVENKSLAMWVCTQKKSYSTVQNERKCIMRVNEIVTLWEGFMNRYPALFLTHQDEWKVNLKLVENFILKNNRLPGNKDKKIGYWVGTQKKSYSTVQNERKCIMRDNEIETLWEAFTNRYPALFLTNEEEWKARLEQVEEFVVENGRLPSQGQVENKSLAMWVSTQKQNYSTVQNERRQIMRDNKITTLWEAFMNRYPALFLSRQDEWKARLEQVKKFVNKNERLPSKESSDVEEKKLGHWVSNQKINYSSVQNESQHIMRDNEIATLWEAFMNRYPALFLTNEEEWKARLEQVEEFVVENRRLPSQTDNKKLNTWVSTQKENYSSVQNERQCIMRVNEIATLWEAFMNRYPALFLSRQDEWKARLEQVKKFVNKNGRLPTQGKNEKEEIKLLCRWIDTQQSNYSPVQNERQKIMKNNEIATLWEAFMNRYSALFLTNEEEWKARLEQVEDFVIKNKRLPYQTDNKKLNTWVSTQKKNYSTVQNERKCIMRVNEIVTLWEGFMNKSALFLTNEEEWKEKLEQVKKFVVENRKLPSRTGTDKKLETWISTQKKNYSPVQSERQNIMKNNEIATLWKDFMTQHPTLFKNEASTQEQKVDYTNLEKYTVQQLKTICSTLNVAFASKTKKDELIELIKAKVNNTPPSPQTKHPSQPTKPLPKSTKVKKTTQKETKEEETKNQNRTQSNYQKLTHKMAVQASSTTNTMFKNEPALWEKYHSSRDISFQGYDNQDEIPVNKIIKYLETKNKRRLKILDLGCGRNKIKDHFKSNSKFTVVGYDHVAYNGSIEVDISSLPDEYESVNMCIFSQSLMGSNWVDYLIEAKRVLMYGGEIIISESHNRFEDIKTKLIELGFSIKREELNQTENTVERWFYIIAINE
jgi:superfamily II DNA or RNA helicase